MPRRLFPAAGAVAGVAVALALTLLQESTYRADASLVLVRQGQPPGSDPRLAAAAGAAAELFDSRAVAESAIANLGLDESPAGLVERLEASAARESSLVRLRVDAPSRDEARQTAQEIAEVSTVLYNDRFGPETSASVWEAASVRDGRVAPKPTRNLALGALVGALAGWVLALAAGRSPRLPRQTPRLRRQAPRPIAAEPVTAVTPVPPPPAGGPFVMPAFGEWTVADVERLLAEHGAAFPERREELELYLDTFRSVADADGRLPGDVDLVIEDVYADLIARAGSTRRG